MTCHLARKSPTAAQLHQTAADAPTLIADWLLAQTERPLARRSTVDLMISAERELGLPTTVTTHTLARAAVMALDRVLFATPLAGAVTQARATIAAHDRKMISVAGAVLADADPVAVRMAKVMHEAAASGGSCDAHQLADAGFSPAEIIEHLVDAQRLADRLAGRDDPEIVR